MELVHDMQRVMIIGSGGAGKSTLARRLGQKLGIPVVHLDVLFWKPGWQHLEDEEWLQTHATTIQGDKWVIDGNFRSTMHLRLAAADTVIFLDFPKWLCLWRVVKRRIQYHRRARPDLGGGNYERLTWEFIRWILTYPRRDIEQRLRTGGQHLKILQLKDEKAVEGFLAEL